MIRQWHFEKHAPQENTLRGCGLFSYLFVSVPCQDIAPPGGSRRVGGTKPNGEI
jgi:hypothetical protein